MLRKGGRKMSNRRSDTPPEIDFAEGFSVNSTLLEDFRQRRQSVDETSSRQQKPEFHAHKSISNRQNHPESEWKEADPPGDASDAAGRISNDFSDSSGMEPQNDNAWPSPTNGKGKKSWRVFCLIVLLMIVAIAGVCVVKSIKTKYNGILYGTDSESNVTSSDYSLPVSPADQMKDSSEEVTSTESTQSGEETKPRYKTLKLGDKNKQVMKMQRRLLELGYVSQDSCTGYYGEFTKKRVKLFQTKANLKATGIADAETLERLYADDAPKYK